MIFKLIYLPRRNPSIKPEDWPRTWRSHAIFVSQFPAVAAPLGALYYCARIREPMLDGTACDVPGVAADYDGVAVVSSSSLDALRVSHAADVRAKIDQDELRVFSTYTPKFSFYCRELLVQGGSPGAAAVIRFLARKVGTSREDFVSYWSERHGDIAKRAADVAGTVARYVHDGLVEEPPPGYPFDGITETWFASVEDTVRSLVDPRFAPVAQDLTAFCDMGRSVVMLTKVFHRWPRD